MPLFGVEIANFGANLFDFGPKSLKFFSLATLALAKTCFIGVSSDHLRGGGEVSLSERGGWVVLQNRSFSARGEDFRDLEGIRTPPKSTFEA